MIEIWKDIKGYEGLYQVNNLGNVKSLVSNKILKPMISNSGYFRVDLFKKHNRNQFSIHRLVALHFIIKPSDKDHVNHKDEDKLNNNVENLEWVTHEENCNYGTAIKRRVENTNFKSRAIDYTNCIEATSKPIIQFSREGKFIKRYNSLSECARENNFKSVSNISRCCQGERNTAYGYKFKFERNDDLFLS